MSFSPSIATNTTIISDATPRWYYYLDRDPYCLLPSGWHAYGDALNVAVEHLYRQWNSGSSSGSGSRDGGGGGHWIPLTTTSHHSGFDYQINFTRNLQCNRRTGKQRPIARTTHGGPPSTSPDTTRTSHTRVAVAGATASTTRAGSNDVNNNGTVTARAWKIGSVLHYRAPSTLVHQHHLNEGVVFDNINSPQAATIVGSQDCNHQDEHGLHDECPICMDDLWDCNHNRNHRSHDTSAPSSPKRARASIEDTTNANAQTTRVVALKTCKHAFHYHCIKEALTKLGLKCPKCRVALGEHNPDNNDVKNQPSVLGKSPGGTMTTRHHPTMYCHGYDNVGTWQVIYSIPSGIQADYHPSPGLRYSGFSTRIAFVPDTILGRNVLVRLQYAFAHGLTFTVGTSLTTQQSNTVVWTSIHHKTSISGGVSRHGFPDAEYFNRVMEELDHAGVPNDSSACQQWYATLPTSMASVSQLLPSWQLS